MSNDIPTELPNLPPRSLDWSHILENEYIVLTRLKHGGAQQQRAQSFRHSLGKIFIPIGFYNGYDWISLKLYVIMFIRIPELRVDFVVNIVV